MANYDFFATGVPAPKVTGPGVGLTGADPKLKTLTIRPYCSEQPFGSGLSDLSSKFSSQSQRQEECQRRRFEHWRFLQPNGKPPRASPQKMMALSSTYSIEEMALMDGFLKRAVAISCGTVVELALPSGISNFPSLP